MSSARRARGSTPVRQSQNPSDTSISSTNGAGDASMASATPGTPKSPLLAARIEEREFLKSCNNKLAAYIERNRQLQNENQRVTSQLSTIQTTHVSETTRLRDTYENMLQETRQTLDRTSNERAQIQLDYAKLHTEIDEIKQSQNQLMSERDEAVKRANACEAKLADAVRKADDAELSRLMAAKELADMANRNAAREHTLKETQTQLEKETLARVEAQNMLQSERERATFQENVLKQQITEVRSVQEATVTKISVELQEEYDSRLEEALENMRSQYADQLDQIRADVERAHRGRMNELRQQAERLMTEAKQARSELSSSRTRGEDLQSQMSNLTNQNQLLQSRLRDSEKITEQLRRERDEQHSKLVAEIERLNDDLAQLRQEHNELLESRITIDMELQAYRKMLDAEEERLSPHGLGRPRKRARRGGAETPAGPSHDASFMSQQQKTEVRYTARQHVTGPLEISDIDPDGKFVRLVNVGETDALMSFWQFKLSGGDLEDEVTHKFSRGFQLGPQMSCTVWANSKVAPSPVGDSDVLARPNAARFPAPSEQNPSIRVVLQDNQKPPNVIADVEVRREVVVVGSEADGGQFGSPDSNRQCVLM